MKNAFVCRMAFCTVLFAFLLLTGCSACVSENEDSLVSNAESGVRSSSAKNKTVNKKSIDIQITNWNTQTFFDSVTEGTEYSEFVKSSSWNRDVYIQRLKRLVSVIKAVDSDVFVMEEIENEGVMYDISNFLAGEWNAKKIYSYGCFVKDDGSSIGLGVLSRFPLSNVKVHSIDVRTENSVQPSSRPILEVTVVKDNKPITLFVNHWKSKSGSAEESECWRNWQENVLAGLCVECEQNGGCFAATGDFNRDIKEFSVDKYSGTVLLGNRSVSCARNICLQKSIEVSAPWYDNGELLEPGSYFFNNGWERIDHVFVGGLAKVILFCTETDGAWCDSESKRPFGFTVWNGEGYSDHLPVTAVIRY